jgi:hypothetical protein
MDVLLGEDIKKFLDYLRLHGVQLPPAPHWEEDIQHVSEAREPDYTKMAMSLMGKVGGLSKSPAKAAAARRNGLKGGRPRKRFF